MFRSLDSELGLDDPGVLRAEIFLLKKEVSRLQRASDVEKVKFPL